MINPTRKKTYKVKSKVYDHFTKIKQGVGVLKIKQYVIIVKFVAQDISLSFIDEK